MSKLLLNDEKVLEMDFVERKSGEKFLIYACIKVLTESEIQKYNISETNFLRCRQVRIELRKILSSDLEISC